MKRTCLTLLMISVAILVVAWDCSESQATARSTAGLVWTSVQAATNCNNGNVCNQAAAGLGNNNVFCQSQNANGTWVKASARAWVPWRVAVAVNMQVKWPDWAWGKEETKMPNPDVVIGDSIEVVANYIPGPPRVAIHIKGNAKSYPTWCGNNWSKFEVAAYEKHTNDTCFAGWAQLVGNAGPSGTIPTDWDTTINDTIFVTYDYYDTVSYSGIGDSLMIEIIKRERGWNVPTTTQWGIIILVVLIVSSAVFIGLRRRRAAVPA